MKILFIYRLKSAEGFQCLIVQLLRWGYVIDHLDDIITSSLLFFLT